MTHIVTTVNEWRKIRSQHKELGFVPTMGNLHAGHAALLERAKAENQVAASSIFVNPTQFNDPVDYQYYPRTIEADLTLLEDKHIDYVFLPAANELYPHGFEVSVQESTLSQMLEGQCRPGHFTGMLTVVLKLFNIIQPTRAYFGEKDYQQLMLVKKMAADLFLPIDIVACETVRAQDGLALSSRNGRLSDVAREKAGWFAKLLAEAPSCEQVKEALLTAGYKIDYVEEQWGRRLAAIWIDNVRLIDNVEV